jgi:hypothetical protein
MVTPLSKAHIRIALCLALFLCVAASSFAAGSKEQDFRKAAGSTNWEYVYDISALSPGKYNLLIEGKDRAGNVATQGPYNVWVDPKSDLPVVSISNPTPGLRVGGSLNIVGTCVDDDGVDRVEVQLDQGEFRPAVGRDFWSLLLADASLPDGRHTVSARGVDINGTTGNPVSVSFNLDTMRPLIRMSSHESGTLASGTFLLEGTVEDANGVRALGYNTDGGPSFTPLSLALSDEGRSGRFRLSVDTRRMKDGPSVYWFEAADRTGSTGRSAFLFFVDNTGPALQILFPSPGQKLSGKGFVCGKVTEQVGIRSLSYVTWDGRKGAIELTPGDPYWAHEFDFTSVKAPAARVSFTVEDLVGNRTVVAAEIALDPAADLPVVSLLSPAAGAPVPADALLSGFARDDDGIRSLVYSLDKTPPVTLGCSGAFAVTLPGLAPGRHTLAAHALDVNGTAGRDSVVEFTSTGAPPAASVDSVVTRTGSTSFRPGAEVERSGAAAFAGRIVTPGRIKTAEYSFNAEPFQKLADMKPGRAGETAFLVKVPPAIPFGVAKLTVRVSDDYGQQAEWIGVFHVANNARRGGAPGVYFADSRIQADGTVQITEEFPLSGVLAGEEIATVAVEPPSDLVTASVEGDRIIVRPHGTGAGVPVRISATTKRGHVFRSPELRFVTDQAAPASTLIRPAALSEGKEAAPYTPGMAAVIGPGASLTGSIAAAALKAASYAVQGGQPRPLSTRKGDKAGELSFSAALPADLPFGRIEVLIRITDPQGLTAEHLAWFWRVDRGTGEANDGEGIFFADTRLGPDGGILLSPGESLSGFFNGRPVAELLIDPPARALEAAFDGNLLTLKAVGEGVPGPVRLRVKTVDGDLFESSPLVVRSDAGSPALALESPAPGAWVGKRVSLKGTAADPNGIRSATFAVGDAAPVPLTLVPAAGGSAFSGDLDLEGAADGALILTVKAEDGAGRTAVMLVALARDTTSPEISFITPLPADPVNGLITVAGTVTDTGIVERLEFSPDGKTWTPLAPGGFFAMPLDLSSYDPLPQAFHFRATDRSGNAAEASPPLDVQLAMDRPEVRIQIPQDGEVLRGDFAVSGMAFDDDGVGAILYRIDGGELVKLPGASSFSVPVRLADVADNEHVFEVKVEDLHGVASELARSTFKVSRAEPVSSLLTPPLTVTARGTVTLTGESSDRNGIGAVSLSSDNGRTFDRVEGTTSWTYRLDTRVLKDGTHSLLVRAVDGYGTEGLYTTLISVDNTAPAVTLDLPVDGSTAAGSLTLDGRAGDNIQLTSLTARLSPAGGGAGSGSAAGPAVELPRKGSFSQGLDAAGLAPGWYDLVVEARDKAENTTTVSRNILLQPPQSVERAEILFPVEGEGVAGPLSVAGRVVVTAPAAEVQLLIDGTSSGTLAVDANGAFGTSLEAGVLADGPHTLEVTASLPGGRTLRSPARRVEYRAEGPWVRITSHPLGSFINSRPFLAGEAGWASAPAEGSDPTAAKAREQEGRARRVERVEVSFDNGKTFTPAQGTEKWRYRIETQSYPDGEVRLMARAVFADGSTAAAKTILDIDDTPPVLTLVAPREEGRYNSSVSMTGTARDENGISEVRVALRTGDKAAYEVPSFIQGLYFEGHALGATVWDVGAGLTFFDNNVKLQAQVGFLPADSRFSGLSLGAKLLANIARLPFSFFLGPDWEFLSASLALGANFSYVTNSGSAVEFTDKGLMLGGVLAQVEFPILRVPGWRMLNTYSIVSEYQLWFISSDVSAGTVSRLAFGLRVGLF